MNKALIAAAAAATLWGGVALAQEDSGSAPSETQTEPAPDTTVRTPSTSQTPQDSWRDRSVPDEQTGVGGSGPETVQTGPSTGQAEQLQCTCRNLGTGIGGSGLMQAPPSNPPPPAAPPPPASENGYPPPERSTPSAGAPSEDQGPQSMGEGTGGSGDTVVVSQGSDRGTDLSGVTVLLGGGFEGYTGGLAPRLGVGPSYGAALQLRPTPIFGVELAYTGGVHEIKDNLTHGVNVASGADIVRNGGRAMVMLGLPTPVQPYLAGGVGVDWYNVRGRSAAFGFRDDTAGEIPLGAGVRAQVGAFTADLRGLYNIPFSQDFAPGVSTQTTDVGVTTIKTQDDGRYQATLSVGANF